MSAAGSLPRSFLVSGARFTMSAAPPGLSFLLRSCLGDLLTHILLLVLELCSSIEHVRFS